jgi:hypothetical protein
MQAKGCSSSVEIGVGTVGRIRSNRGVGKVEHLFPSLLGRTKISKAEISRVFRGSGCLRNQGKMIRLGKVRRRNRILRHCSRRDNINMLLLTQ